MPGIAVIGCGRMGLPMARRLLDAGHEVVAYDVSEAARDAAARAGATVATSAGEAAGAAATLITMLPDPPAVEAVADELLGGLNQGALWLEMTSSSPDVTARLAVAAAERGAELLDAPVSGGVAGAEAGRLTIMLGGPASVVERARPLLELLGATLVHVGDRPGDGDAAKTINNMLSATNLAAVSEALAIGLRAGLDPERLLDCVNGGTGASDASRTKVAGHVLTGRFGSGFTIAQYVKDLRIAAALALAHEIPAPVNDAARAVWVEQVTRGAGDEDHTRMTDHIVRDAGIAPPWPHPDS